MEHEVTLSPVQIDFICNALPGVDLEMLHAEIAGSAASQRLFTRLHWSGKTYILVEWDSADEDWPRFLSIAQAREATSLLLPEIYAEDARHGLILEEDLGAVTLRKFCEQTTTQTSGITDAYQQVIDALRIWQQPQVAAQPVIAAREMDVATFLWETDYFARFCVTDFCGEEKHLSQEWEQERTRLAHECALLTKTAMHRDFQSENILMVNGCIRFVDFQGARLGPGEYDLASLLFDPYIPQLDKQIRQELYHYAYNIPGSKRTTSRPFSICAVQRLMQALGAYGNLSLHKGKPRYRKYIPAAIGRLAEVVESLDDYPSIRRVVDACALKVESSVILGSEILPAR